MNDHENQSNGKVSIALNAEDRILLERIFENEDVEQVANRLAQAAFREWLDWMAGVKRYYSPTDQAIERVISIYTLIMPDKEPDVSFLYNKLNIPYGRARYITQAIVNRQLFDLNTRALERLIQTLEDKAHELNKMSEEERKRKAEIRFVTDQRAEKMLTTLIELMPLEERPVTTLKRFPSPLPNTRDYSMAPGDLELVLKEAKKLRDSRPEIRS